MNGDLCALQVRVHGRPVREYQHEGKLYIEGRQGSEFTLRVKNLTNRRILAVLSIDGLSILTGKDASVTDPGYVLAPHETLDIPGWSLNNNEVARFFFNQAGKSYAAKMGKPKNIGVIGCAIYREKTLWMPIIRTYNCSFSEPVREGPDWSVQNSSTGSAPPPTYGTYCSQVVEEPTAGQIRPDSFTVESSSVPRGAGKVRGGPSPQKTYKKKAASLAQSEIGTGFGKRQTFRVNEVNFEKESETPNEVLDVTYDTRKGLENRGVDLKQKPVVANEPSPFPADKHCQPPEGWNG